MPARNPNKLPPVQRIWNGVQSQQLLGTVSGQGYVQGGPQQNGQYVENWTGNQSQQQQQFYQGTYPVTPENGSHGYIAMNETHSVAVGDVSTTEYDPLADNRMYEQYSQQGYVADQGNGAYDYSNNFVDNTYGCQQPQSQPQPVTVTVAPTHPRPISIVTPAAAVIKTVPIQEPTLSTKDPLYLEKRRKNNLAAKESRKKKKKSFQEMEAKCARQKEKIAILKKTVAELQAAKDWSDKRFTIVSETLRALQAKKHVVEDDDVQVIGQVAIPSGQGFGGEKSQDF